MRSPRFMTAVALVVMMPVTALAQDAAQPRPTLTIAQFETDRTGWVPPPGFGETMAELLGQRLVASGQFRVLDAAYLTRDLDNVGRGRSERLPLELIRERAARAGVRYLVLGTLTQYSREQRQRSGGGAAIIGALVGARLHAPVAPIVGGRRSSQESVIALSIRVIDLETGEIVTTAVGQGAASRTNRSATTLGIVGGAPFGGGFSSSSSNAAEAMLGEALEDALNEVSDALLRAAGAGKLGIMAASRTV